ncbi:hypothetical protein ACIRPP_24840 [Streptomyces sp. NPDC101219]|uniref:hypothetical protein n=1 Tax=Streptomyces sp. NPDC101219 TaxID=3366131 RepID=UPI00380681C5
MALTGSARVWVWATAVVTGLTAAGLILLVVLRDLDTAGQAASVAGAVVGLIGLLVSVVALLRGGGTAAPAGAATGRRVRADDHGIAVGGDVTGSALGRNAKVTGPSAGPGTPRPAPRDTRDDVRARQDGIAVGGDVTDSALGEGSER